MTDFGRHIDDASCADLVLGLFDAPTRARALEHVAACEACALRLRSHARAHERANAGILQREPVRLPLRRVILFASAVAATFLAVVLWHGPSSQVPLDDAHWLPVPREGVLWREGQTENAHLAAGLSAYARRDVPGAARELEGAKTTGSGEQARRLYLSHVRLMQGREREAVVLLQSIEWNQLPVAVERDGVQLLARTLRATGAGVAADSLERALASTPEWVPVLP